MNYKKTFNKINFKEPSNVIMYGVVGLLLLFVLFWIIKVLMILLGIVLVGYLVYWYYSGNRKKERKNEKM